ncbi:hypothetical protein [Reichenbachiella ulvae]|uniref:DUF2490 domain-containing protein n=1 Tax=Reichenbachiella ulvae TaxID=2980104 RepID=A0ABT3CP93_9BACT|nr:hypothetical protein [Reichenbachiella ulvae]MCV9385548.1 hypothetical protein [Reichenbachiella ulvae]
MIKTIPGLILLLLVNTTIWAQSTIDSVQSKYIQIGIGGGKGSLRDFGTSPLTYSGAQSNLTLNYLSIGSRKKLQFGIEYTAGSYSAGAKNEISSAQRHTIDLHYSELHRLKALSSENWNTKVGGKAMITGNLRLNPSLQNAQLGLEAFMNLMAAFQVNYKFDQLEDKQRHIWFIRYTTKARKRRLSYDLNVGLINHNLRNGYTYIDQSGVLNEPKIFGDYQFNQLNGMRVNASLAYTRYMASNKNAIQIAYFWDMIYTREDYHSFEMATHTLKCVLMFNLK